MRLGLLGLALQAGTSDLRDLPALAVARQLRERGAGPRAYDPARSETRPGPGDLLTIVDAPPKAVAGGAPASCSPSDPSSATWTGRPSPHSSARRSWTTSATSSTRRLDRAALSWEGIGRSIVRARRPRTRLPIDHAHDPTTERPIVRVLFTTLGSPSKGRAQLPLARAFAAAGHKVLMATNRSLAPVFEPDDLQVATCMDDFSPASFIPPEQTEQLAGPGLSKEERQEALVRNMVLAMAGPMAAKVLEWVLPVARDFRPDLILRDGMDLGSCLIAEHLGIPQLPTPAGSGNMIDPVEVLPGLNAVREEQGLPTQEDPLSMIPHGRIDCVPGAFSFARHLPPSWCYRQSLAVERHSVLPGWIAELPTHRPVVFAAIGTALAMRRRPAAGGHGGPPPVPSPVETLRSMIKAVSALDECTVIVATSGVAVESDDLPPHVHVTDWVPQPLLLESVDVFLTHGGFNSVREALRTGTPMAVLPQFGDQPSNARRVQELGLGRNITDGTPDGITTALREVLADSGVRAKARQARLAMLALPEVDSAVADMEKIAG